MARSILRAGKIAGVIIVAIIVVAAVLYSAGVLSVAQTDYPPPETVASPESLPAEPAEALLAQCESSYTQANDYWELEKYDEAKALYQYISQNSPDSDLAFKAKADVAYCEIRLRNDSAAEQVIEALKNDYSRHKDLYVKIFELAEEYKYRGNTGEAKTVYDKAKALYQYVIQNSSDSNLAIQAQAWVAGCQIQLGNDSAAEQAFETLTNNYSQHPELFTNIDSLASYCWRRRKYDKSRDLYQYIAQTCSDSNLAIKAQTQVAVYEINSGNESAAELAIETLTNDYFQHPELCTNIYDLAEKYWKLKKYNKAKALYQYLSRNSSDSNWAIKGQTWVAGCQIALGNDSAAELAIETLTNDYSQHPDLCAYIYDLANYSRKFEKFDKAGELYQYISQNYPNSNPALKIRAQVVIREIRLGDYSAAEEAFETLCAEYSSAEGFVDSVLAICKVFIRKNDPAMALPYINCALQASPDHEKAVLLLRTKAECYASMGATDMVDTVIDEIAQTDLTDTEFLGTLNKTADRYREQGYYDKSIELYQEVIDSNSVEDQQLYAYVGIARSYFQLGDEPAAQQVLDELTLRFAYDPRVSRELYKVGEYYRTRKNYPSARALYDYIATEFPQTSDAMWSAQRQIVMDIDETEDPNHPTSQVPPEIMQAIENIVVDYAHIPQLTRAVCYLGEDYYLRIRSREGDLRRNTHRYDNAISIWQIVINKLPYQKTYTPFAYYLCAHCCERTEQYDKAITCYEKLTEAGYRHGRYAYRAPRQLARLYKYQKKDYEKAAYWFARQNKLFDKDSGPAERRYGGPSGQKSVCDNAMWALGVLYRLDLKDYDKALEAYREYQRQFPQGIKADLAPLSIARCYRGKGDIATAIEILQTALDEKPDMRHADEYRRVLDELQKGAE